MSKVAKTQPVLDKSMKMECTSTASLITIKIVFQPYKITVVDSCIMGNIENLMSKARCGPAFQVVQGNDLEMVHNSPN